MFWLWSGGTPHLDLSTEKGQVQNKNSQQTEHQGDAGSGSVGSQAGGSGAIGTVFDDNGAAELGSIDSGTAGQVSIDSGAVVEVTDQSH